MTASARTSFPDAAASEPPRGIHEQVTRLDPKAGIVIARHASHPLGANSPHRAPTWLPACAALGPHLLGNG